jgi:hypothetical protein
VTGWIADFFRFWWALFYWNTRKTWFRLHGAHRDSCPCQNFSDSGHALDSRCIAVELWQKPARFRRVCPLLTETKEGWRCGVDAERVRPFWARAAGYFGASLLMLYLLGSIAVYTVLHAVNYEVSYTAVVWPPHWSELRVSQERLHATRAQRALAEGNFKAAILSLRTVCELNPRNYSAGLTLASLVQSAGQPYVADHIYNRLMHDVPEERTATARLWIRPLLARGAYAQIKLLAPAMLSEDSTRREAWLHVLFFAARETHDQEVLRPLLKSDQGLPDWCVELIGVEQLLLENRVTEATARLDRLHTKPAISYIPTYQVDRLLRLNRPEQAGRLLDAYGDRVPADEAAFLRLRAYRAQKWTSLLEPSYDTLLSIPMTERLGTLFCAYLIELPEQDLLARFLDRIMEHGPVLSNETLPLFHAAYLTAIIGGDPARAQKTAETIKRFTSSDLRALRTLGALLQSGAPPQQIGLVLPLVPLPLEVVYAIHLRQPAAIAR